MNRPKILVTHIDLDGVGCAVLYMKAFPGTQVYFTEYDKVNELLAELITEAHWASDITITDMSPSAEMAEVLHRRGNVSLIDHHPTALYLMDKYPWAVVDPAHSATRLVYEMLAGSHYMSDYEEFAKTVDNYDMWGHGQGPTETAKKLNDLLWSMGQERFLKRFVMQSSIALSPTEDMILLLEHERKVKYIDEAIPQVNILTDQHGYKYGLVAAELYSSQLGNDILANYAELEYVIMLNFLKDKASLRGRGNLDMGEMAKALGGGGHKKAAGFPLEQSALKYFYGGGSNGTDTRDKE